jgi:enoyl-[acyl-carrier-protein] reductase (NADH)
VKTDIPRPVLKGTKVLVVGIANRHSIAYGCASACTRFPRARSRRAPAGELVDIMDVGFACAYLATPYARRITGETMYVDGGVNIVA